MTTLAFPTLSRGPSEALFRLRAATQIHRSPFDGSVQTLKRPGAVWVATLSYPSFMEADRRAMAAFVADLEGRGGRFNWSPIQIHPRRATGGGTPVVLDASQTGKTLTTQGWGAGVQAAVKGDLFSFLDGYGRSRLHMVTADASADVLGRATLAITPALRGSPLPSTALEFAAPYATFMLSEDEVGVATRAPLLGSVTLEFEEALV